ncbi:MAG: competence/damage-inducible protein A [Deltaproteobacteria bacterium]|nr:competence/damage-inducible protein A [Deltaproteobacteria bacterium]MBW2016642.1 competence/damage-inducible protein A [Deltaproteobacteria bacterium]MBW2130128.1 competence/damage-inducible protein A [Deltaproteobacteria bacterium]MBW2303750.1 competence/damage-inducible protein A [Deltaproteobacteria bacterium]
MYGEIITIGNELISGRTMDLNAWYAAGRLTASGLKVTRITTVGDDPERVSRALTEAVRDSRFVIVTGGLGSTEDDMTCEIAAQALDRPLRFDKQMFQRIKKYVEVRGIELSPSLEKMAWMPEGSSMLHPEGNFCGFSLSKDSVRLYFLPGVPDQMRFLMDKFVLPEILARYETLPVMRQRILKLYGLSEPKIADVLKELLQKRRDVILGFYPHFPENHITMSLRGRDEAGVTEELDRMEKEIREILDPYIFTSGNQTMESVVGERLREKAMTVSVAESCTGGLIGHLLTNVPGSSAYFMGGMTVYSNQAKVDLLGVSPRTLEKVGAVSDGTAREMARGVRDRMKTDIGLAVTGIAGPDGGSRDKPVGTVHIALTESKETFSRRYRFWGTRIQIKQNTAMMALDWLRRYLDGNPFLSGI